MESGRPIPLKCRTPRRIQSGTPFSSVRVASAGGLVEPFSWRREFEGGRGRKGRATGSRRGKRDEVDGAPNFQATRTQSRSRVSWDCARICLWDELVRGRPSGTNAARQIHADVHRIASRRVVAAGRGWIANGISENLFARNGGSSSPGRLAKRPKSVGRLSFRTRELLLARFRSLSTCAPQPFRLRRWGIGGATGPAASHDHCGNIQGRRSH